MERFNITQFNGKIIKSCIKLNKALDFGEKIRTLTISDLHNYTKDYEMSIKLARTIVMQQPDVIFIAGDLFNGGNAWEGGSDLEKFMDFLRIISTFCPVVISLGNHDLRGMNENNKERRLNNFYELEKIPKVHSLYNDKVYLNGMEIVGYVPRFELMELEGLQKQIHGLAHKEFIEDYMRDGQSIEGKDGILTVYVGHDPHLIATDEQGIGLQGLSKIDFFVTGHIHDGYKFVLNFVDQLSRKITGNGLQALELDGGYTEQPTGVVDKNGNKIKSCPKIWGKTNLCRGIVYINDDAQQRILQLPDGKIYKNISHELNVQKWVPVSMIEVELMVKEEGLHYMLISEGISPGFISEEKWATMNIVDFYSKTR